MKSSPFCLFLIVLIIASTSCKKENSSPDAPEIKGTWNFISMEVKSTSINEFSNESGKQTTINTNNFTTENNSGTVLFDGSKISVINFAYTINTVTKAEVYVNDQLQRTIENTVNAIVPPSSTSATYHLIGSDSIHFENGAMLFNNVLAETVTSGAKLSLEGDVLYMTSSINDATTNIVDRVKLQRQ